MKPNDRSKARTVVVALPVAVALRASARRATGPTVDTAGGGAALEPLAEQRRRAHSALPYLCRADLGRRDVGWRRWEMGARCVTPTTLFAIQHVETTCTQLSAALHVRLGRGSEYSHLGPWKYCRFRHQANVRMVLLRTPLQTPFGIKRLKSSSADS